MSKHSTVTLPAGQQITLTHDGDESVAILQQVEDPTIRSVLTSGTATYGPYNAVTHWDAWEGVVTLAAATSKREPSRVVTDATTAHDITAAESGSYLRMTSTSAKTVTFRPQATHALPADGEWDIYNAGATGDITLTPGSGVTMNAPASGTLVVSPGATVKVKRAAANTFDVSGQTVAA